LGQYAWRKFTAELVGGKKWAPQGTG
jgi:hypothetical protein